jgi:hypothetical protein
MASICKGIDEALELIDNYIKNKIWKLNQHFLTLEGRDYIEIT